MLHSTHKISFGSNIRNCKTITKSLSDYRQMWEKDNSFDTPLFDKRSIQTGLNCIENYLQMTLLKRLKKQKMQFQHVFTMFLQNTYVIIQFDYFSTFVVIEERLFSWKIDEVDESNQILSSDSCFRIYLSTSRLNHLNSKVNKSRLDQKHPTNLRKHSPFCFSQAALILSEICWLQFGIYLKNLSPDGNF